MGFETFELPQEDLPAKIETGDHLDAIFLEGNKGMLEIREKGAGHELFIELHGKEETIDLGELPVDAVKAIQQEALFLLQSREKEAEVATESTLSYIASRIRMLAAQKGN